MKALTYLELLWVYAVLKVVDRKKYGVNIKLSYNYHTKSLTQNADHHDQCNILSFTLNPSIENMTALYFDLKRSNTKWL